MAQRILPDDPGAPPRRILLVDDVAAQLELERAFFANERVEILTAGDGHEALRLVREARPDLVFVDESMPGLLGHEVCSAVKGDEVLRDIPVVIVTGATDDASIEACMASGCDDYLAKPVEKRALLHVAEKFLDTRRRRPTRMLVKIAHVGLDLGATPDAFFGYTVDLSDRGLLLETDEPLRPAQELDLQFFLPRSGDKVMARGTVVREIAREAGDPPAYGVRIDPASEQAARLIHEYVARVRPTRDLDPPAESS
jgi:CheY-like chemotaxis protein